MPIIQYEALESRVNHAPRTGALALLAGIIAIGSVYGLGPNKSQKNHHARRAEQGNVFTQGMTPSLDETSPKEATTTTTQPPPVITSNEAQMFATLGRIGGCESNDSPSGPINYQAQNPTSTASGGFQILDTTWNFYGGYQSAKDAPPDIQLEKAVELYAQRGTEPWVSSESCWD